MKYTPEDDLIILNKINAANKEGVTAKIWTELGATLNRNPDAVRKHAMEGLGTQNVRANVQSRANNVPVEDKLLKYISEKKTNKVNLIEVCDLMNLAPAKILEAVKQLREKSINIEVNQGVIELSSTINKEESLKIDAKSFFNSSGRTFKFGHAPDWHINSKYERLDALDAYMNILVNEGITKLFVAGNPIDGEARFNKYDIQCSGVENQIQRFIDVVPQKKNLEIDIETGDDHEAWYTQREFINVGQLMQLKAEAQGRFDIKYIGHMERDIVLKGAKTEQVIRIIHGGGGSAYATSYTSQKYAESLGAGEKPRIVLIGHFHKFEYCYPREIHMIQGGCFEDQTPFMRKRRLQAMVGGTIVTVHQNCDGIIDRVQVEWIPFYGKKFYQMPLTPKHVENEFKFQW